MRAHRWPLAASVAAVVAAFALVAVATASVPAPAGPAFNPPAAEHPPAESVVFLERVLRQIIRDDYARVWQTLNPAQQRAIPRDAYVQCELLSPITGRIQWIRAIRVVGKPIVVPGGSGEPVFAQAVTFRLKVSQRSLRGSAVITHTAHAVAEGGRWTWILPARRFALHSSGRCLSGG